MPPKTTVTTARPGTRTLLSIIGVIAMLAAAALVSADSTAAPAAARVKVYFVVGKQLVPVSRPGRTVEDAVRQLIAGPSAAASRSGARSFVLPGTRLRGASVAGGTATVDLGATFAAGNVEARSARLAQLVFTASSVPGVTSVRVLIQGRAPRAGLFPRYNLTRPLTKAEIARPKVKLKKSPAPRYGTPSAETRQLQQQLAGLGYLPATGVDGRPGMQTTFAVIAFQKWTGLPRDGVAGPKTLAELATATRPEPVTPGTGRRIEVLLDRQLTLLEDGDQVLRTIGVSTGKGSNATPPGSFRIFRKEVKSWSFPFQVWLPWASYFVGGIAFHEYPDIPTQAASHGCVRVPRYDSQFLYHFAPIGTRVRVLSRSV